MRVIIWLANKSERSNTMFGRTLSWCSDQVVTLTEVYL